MPMIRIAVLAALAALLAGCAGSMTTSDRSCDPNCYSQRTVSPMRL